MSTPLLILEVDGPEGGSVGGLPSMDRAAHG
jgi:hypothetical protein